MDCYILALRLLDWLCFCNKNIGFNRLKAPLRLCSTSTCCTFSFTFMHIDCIPILLHKSCLLPFIASSGRRLYSSCAYQSRTNKHPHSCSCLQHASRFNKQDKLSTRQPVVQKASPCPAVLEFRFYHCRYIHRSPSLIYKPTALRNVRAAFYW